jgi:hypothetical protein
MHPEDERALLEHILADSSVLLIDGPRWNAPTPAATCNVSDVGWYGIIWSPHDSRELNAEFMPQTSDWYCRSQHSTIQ